VISLRIHFVENIQMQGISDIDKNFFGAQFTDEEKWTPTFFAV
jgi:hypothetical protein